MRRMRCTRLGRILADWRQDEREGLATLLGRFNVALLEADRAENIVG